MTSEPPPVTTRGVATSVIIIDAESAELSKLRSRLQSEGHAVLTAATLDEGLALCRTSNPGLVLLDPLLGSSPRFDLCETLRSETDAAIVVLTSSSDQADKILAYDLGADAYVTKPYQLAVLVSRIRNLLRRTHSTSTRQRVFAVRNLRLDLSRRQLTRKGRAVDLRPREFELLAFLMQNRGQTFTREQILGRVWGYHGKRKTRTVDVHIERLRQKVEDEPSSPRFLITVRNVGYQFNG
jgi:DNA-binding response OmpR family regulator